MAEASEFKFGMQLGFAKAHHKITLRGKSGLLELPKILGFPFYISATAEASDFKFCIQLEFAKAHHKITPAEKWAWPLVRGASQKCGFPFNIFATTEDSDFKIGRLVGFAKAHHKIPPKRKKGVALS